jgi:hypothetical protein
VRRSLKIPNPEDYKSLHAEGACIHLCHIRQKRPVGGKYSPDGVIVPEDWQAAPRMDFEELQRQISAHYPAMDTWDAVQGRLALLQYHRAGRAKLHKGGLSGRSVSGG